MDAQLTIVDVTGSTNDDLLEAGKQGAPHGTGLAARAQTAEGYFACKALLFECFEHR